MSSDTNDDDRGDLYAKEKLMNTELPEPVKQYLDGRVKARYSHRTYINRRGNYRHYKRFCEVHGYDFLEPSVVLMDDFIDHQLNHGYSEGSIENRVYDLSALFQYLSNRDVVESNPVADDAMDMDVVKSGTDFSDIRYIEEEDYETLLGEIDSVRDELLVRLLWQTGVRAKELVNIKIGDIDRSEQEIETAKQDDPVFRTVFYQRSVEHLLTKWLDRGARDAYLSAENSDYLLVGKESEQLHPNRPTELIRKYAAEDRADIQTVSSENRVGEERRSVTAHAFRHSYAVHRVKNGMPIVFLSDLLGHSDLSQTREYLRFRDDDIREADKKYRP